MELTDLIIRTYPWWEMHRVRELSLGPRTPDRHMSNEWRHAPGLVDHTYRGITTPKCDTLHSGAWQDLAAGPMLIEAPATDLPYWSTGELVARARRIVSVDDSGLRAQ